ncbi:MAG: glycosyltransferase family 1 protein [Acidimicrobiaceae bacterium]|nr:glycosyltransferase family 1 protein [Acidimicrobiaceae bacterium]
MNYNTTVNNQLRVTLDVTPLLGPPTGVYQVTTALIGNLRNNQQREERNHRHHENIHENSCGNIENGRDNIRISGYVLSARASAQQLHRLQTRTNLPVTRSRIPAILCLLSWARFSRPRLNRIARHADVIHGTNYTAPPGGSSRNPRPRLITVYDFSMITRPEWCTKSVRRIAPTLYRAAAQGAHLHVTTRSDAAQAVELLKADPARVHRIPLGVRALEGGNPAAGRNLVNSEHYILALGATEPRKNFHSLPKAVAALRKDMKLVVAGPPGASEAALTAAVREHRLDSRYVRLTTVGQQLRTDLICGATVLAHPSLMEGFGLPPLEAVTVGTPVAATAVGVLPEMLGPHTKLTPPGDDEAFAEQLAEIVDNSPPSVPYAQTRISELTWELTAQRLAALYHKISTTP